MLTTLRTYQDRVEALATEAEALLRGEGRKALARICKLRIDQGVAMAAYQLFVHREMFEPIIRAGTPAQIEAAKRLKVECVAFAGIFSHHVQIWSKRDTDAGWVEYQAAALAMIGAVRAHLARVRSELAPALAEHADLPSGPSFSAARPAA